MKLDEVKRKFANREVPLPEAERWRMLRLAP